jgi:predicted nucleotidyltransferase
MTLYDVINDIAPRVAQCEHIHAMWLEGSWATGKNHDGSDIDVWLDVDDGTFERSISVFRAALSITHMIDWEKPKGVYSENPKLQKHTFHLAGFPHPQRIELDLQEHSRGFVFDPHEHIIMVIFDKNETIRWAN